MKLSESELQDLKNDLLYFVKRVARRGFESPEEARVLPEIIKLLLTVPISVMSNNDGLK